MTKLKGSLLIFSVAILLLVLSGSHSPLFSKDDISVSQDKDKTVYTIDSGDENIKQQERERAEGLEILKNMPIMIDGRRNQPLPRQPVQPTPVQPAQPNPAR
jgi:hypothetical protein